jgi:hydrogenase maturation factor
LPPPVLERLLRWRGAPDPRVLVGPGCGVDAAVVALGRRRLILKSDPVTFTARRIGWYAVQVNANDVAVMGGRPAWFQPTILLPPRTRVAAAMTIAREIDRACRALGVAVTGGHTEVTDAVTRPIVAGDMQGLLVASRIITARGARPGHRVLLTKAAGIEGTVILAHERARALSRALPPRLVRAARRLRQRPGISVVPEAVIAARHGASAMHDPTEGGVRAGLHEIAFASGVRLRVEIDRIAVYPQTAAICRHYGIDPLGLIGSGALLVTIAARRVPGLLRAWARRGIAAETIGEVEEGRGVQAWRHGRPAPFPWIARDEIITALASRRRRAPCERDPRAQRPRARVAHLPRAPVRAARVRSRAQQPVEPFPEVPRTMRRRGPAMIRISAPSAARPRIHSYRRRASSSTGWAGTP